MPVEAGASPLISHRGARVGVRGGFLHVAQWHPGVKRSRDERMPQRVRAQLSTALEFQPPASATQPESAHINHSGAALPAVPIC
jgi:hypothetical protein